MIIDFHAHIYPQKIAAKASEVIGEFYDTGMAYKGSVQELVASGDKIGVVRYIVHSTATKPQQVESINNFISGAVAEEKRFVGFGTMHPDYENFVAEIARMQELGLSGVKLHPDFQHFAIDIEKMDPIYEELAARNLPVLVHAGDIRYDYSGPKRIAHVLEKHPNLTVIAAHFGGYTQWAESYEYLCGKRVWFDTSSTLWKLDVPTAMKMIQKHGIEKFLFGSDYPMWDHEDEMRRFNTLALTEAEREMVLFTNAKNLLHLEI